MGHIFRKRRDIHKKRIQNRAQTSIFVILGIFIFTAAIIGFIAYNNIQSEKFEEEAKRTADLSLQAKEVENLVNGCIRKESFQGLKRLGQTGGYLEVPKLIEFRGVGYWHIDQVNIQPFLNNTQERLLEYINSNVPKCVDDEKIKQLGFELEKGELKAAVEYGAGDVTVKVYYPLRLSRQDFTKEFSEFFNTFDIRYRAVFEAATELNEKTFEGDFDEKEPLKKLEYLKNLDFDVAYKIPETDVITFAITDKKSITPENQNYVFNFAAKLGRSELKRATDLQNKSASNPNLIPYTVFSVDKKAQLDISEHTTIVLDGKDVPYIEVQQSYPNEVVAKNIPVEKENKEIKKREDIPYVIDNPVYSFKPSGLLFNLPQKLTLYYDDSQGKDAKGVGILKGENDFWVPIPSEEDRANKKVFANILGFTDFTAIFCESQKLKTVVARNVFEPNTGCYITLGVMVVLIIVSFGVFSVFGFAGLSTLATGGFTAAGTTLASTVGIATTASQALTIGIIFTVLSAVSTIGGVVGAATEVFYTSSPENCQGFVPTCTWDVGVDTVTKDGEGNCIPDGGKMQAGVPALLCAQVEKCNFIEKFTCQKCSVECTAQFY